MATARMTLDPANPPKLSAETRARMAAMTPEQVEAGASGDAENPPLTQEELNRVGKMQAVRNTRARSGLSQSAFAEKYRISLGRLRDLEQGRTEPDDAFLAYMTVIRLDPSAVKRALETVEI